MNTANDTSGNNMRSAARRGALSSVKVIEIGNNVAVAYCCKLMADLGAEVVKVEDPRTGELDRQEGSIWSQEGPGKAGECLFAYVNSNKLGVTLNLDGGSGRGILSGLVQSADVLVEGNIPRKAEGLGLGYDSLSHANEKLVVTSITPFGQTGPYQEYKAYSLNISAAGGASKSIGELGREPLSVPLCQPHFQSGLMAATATLGAILARDSIGRGQHIDIGEAEVWLTHHAGMGLHGFVFHGLKVIRMGRRMGGLFPNGIIECKDGEVAFSANTGHQWKTFLEILGDGEIPAWYASEPKYQKTFFQELYRQFGDEIRPQLEELLKRKTKEELATLGREKHIALSPLQTMSEVVNDPHLNARGYFVEMKDPRLGRLKFPGPPYRFSKTPWQLDRPAPTLGQDNAHVYGSMGYSEGDINRLKQEGTI